MSPPPSSSIGTSSLVQRTPQSGIGDSDPLISAIFRHCVEERRYVRRRVGFLRWNRESPWLALNQYIAREEWTRPTHSWIARRLNSPPLVEEHRG
jgi:hypothetical protein